MSSSFKYAFNDYKQLKKAESWLLDNNRLDYLYLAYYPIAVLEIDITVQSREDFTLVERMILSLIDFKIQDFGVLAEMTGFTKKYVEKVYKLLEGTGHILNKTLTELGRRSLEADQKISVVETSEKLLVDGINHWILSKDFRDFKTTLISKEDLDKNDLSFEMNTVGNDTMLSKLKEDYHFNKNENKMVEYNIESINKCETKQVKYAPVYVIKTENLPLPIVFVKGFYPKEEEKFQLRPICLDEELSYLKEYFSSTYRDNLEIAKNQKMNLVYDCLNQYRDNMKTNERYEEFLSNKLASNRAFSLREDDYHMEVYENHVVVNMSFDGYSKKNLRLSKYLNSQSNLELPLVNLLTFASSINGSVVYLTTDSENFIDLYDFLLKLSKSNILKRADSELKYMEFIKDYQLDLSIEESIECLEELGWW